MQAHENHRHDLALRKGEQKDGFAIDNDLLVISIKDTTAFVGGTAQTMRRA